MTSVPTNTAPYVIGAIQDPGTADFDGVGITHVGGFDTDGINPIVVNADGSFTAAFAVNAPSYEWPINLTVGGSGVTSFLTGGGVAREYSFFSLTPGVSGTITYTLAGRDPAGTIIQIPLTPGENGKIAITEAILANFAPGATQQLAIGGLLPNSSVFGSQTVDLAEFFDGAAPTSEVQAFVSSANGLVPANGIVALSYPSGLTESFSIQNASAWTTGATTFRIIITTQEPLDVTGVTSGLVSANNSTGSGFRTIITVPAVNGVVAVPPTLLQQMEAQLGTVALQVFGAIANAVPQVQATIQLPVTTITEGLYTQNFDADGNPTGEPVRVDVATNALLQDEDDIHYVMARSADGGLVIAWLGNDDADGEADAVYVRKLDDTGTPVGETVTLTGLTAEAFDTIVNDEGEAGIAALADGGYAVAYTVEAETIGQTWTGNVFPGGLSISGVGGQLERVELTQFTAAGAISASLRGVGADGNALVVPVTLTDGVFQMTDALRAQFAPDSHFALGVAGLTANSPYTAFVTVRDVLDYDDNSTLTTTSFNSIAAPNPSIVPDVFISGLRGQTISYEVKTITPGAGETPTYLLTVFTPGPIDTTGLSLYSGAVTIPGVLTNIPNNFSSGYFTTTLAVTPNAVGVIDIPASVLAQVSGDQLSSVLMITGLQAGTLVNVDITFREASSITEPGVFVQTFDADGVAEGPAQRIDDADATLPGGAPTADEDFSLGITAHADGGFHVSWIAQNTDGSDLDRLVTREFDADGELTGTSININGADIPGVAAIEEAGGDGAVTGNLQVVELGNGGFATLVAVEANEISGPVNQVATGGPLFILAAQGRFTSLSVFQATPAAGGVRYFIEGRDDSGTLLSFELTAEDGFVGVPEAVAAQFSDTYYLNFRIDGLQAGTPFSGSTTAADVWNYSDESATITSNGNWTVTSFGGPPIGLAFASQSQSIAFDIVSATPAAGLTPSYLISLQTTFPMDTAGAGLPAQTFNSTFNVWEVVVPVVPDAAGHIDVPPAMLALTEEFGGRINLVALNLAAGSAFVTTTTERLPSSILTEGLFVQLFDSDGQPTGDLIRVDDPATTLLRDEDVTASIESDGQGGFRVAWKSDLNGDYDADGIHIRQFDQNGTPVGEDVTIESIPDRVYDEGAEVLLYTSGLFADRDAGDALTFSATGLPEGVGIDTASGVISGTADEAGLHTVTVTATDSGGLSASTTFDIFVVGDGGPEENQPPTAVAFANSLLETPENGEQVKVADIVVTDDGQGFIVLSLSGEDAGQFSIIDGALYYTGGGDFEGQASYDVTVSARDGELPDAPVSAVFSLALSDVTEDQSFVGTVGPDELLVDPASIDNWTVDGDDGADFIRTGAGTDSIHGLAGNDIVYSGAGDDELRGGKGTDQLFGEDDDDSIFGGDNADTIDGGEGNDSINGGGGTDQLTGGLGFDTFVFSTATDSRFGKADTITDFSVLEDLIDLSGVDANSKVGGNQAFTFIGNAAFGRVAGQLRAVVIGENTHITGDINGDGKADFEIVLDQLSLDPLSGGDFVL